MLSVRRLEAVASACYDAALGQTSWDAALSDVASAFNGSHATLLQQDVPRTRAHVLGSSGFDTATVRAYEHHYKRFNVFLDPANKHLMRPGVVRTGEMMCPDEVLLRSEYYNDFLEPIAVRHVLGTTARLVGPDAVHLTVFRSAAAGVASRQELRALHILGPHVQRALQVHERLMEARGYSHALEALLSRLSRGAALVSSSAQTLYMNEALLTMVRQGDGLAGKPFGFAPRQAAALKRYVSAVADAAAGGSGGRLVVPRPSGATPYMVLVSPLGRALASGGAARPVLVLVSDPAAPTEFDQPLLQEAYGFTHAECLVACQLANGMSVEGIASQSGVTVGTVKTHLKRVLSKTSTHRQADLVRLLLLGRPCW